MTSPCRLMGVEFGGQRRLQRSSLKRVLLAAVLPFLFGILLVFALYYSTTGSKQARRFLEQTSVGNQDNFAPGLGGVNTKPCSLNSGSTELASAEDVRLLDGALTKDSIKKVLGAANSTDPEKQTVRVNEDALPSIFMFVGVLSGRGYR